MRKGGIIQKIGRFSTGLILLNGNLRVLLGRLREIQPDISAQESRTIENYDSYYERRVRLLQAFQCRLMLKALEGVSKNDLFIVDVGDSAGTHINYLKELTKGRFNIDSLSLNMDPRAVEKIRGRGMKAVLCRAEDLDLDGREVDLCLSFETLEHLHNPAGFLRALAKKSSCAKLVITVPYLENSRVGLHHLRRGVTDIVYAEEEHIFELSPQDWRLLMLHSGWKVSHSQVYYQYPRGIPVLSRALRSFWRKTDFEGFWGAILERDDTFSDKYYDWEDK